MHWIVAGRRAAKANRQSPTSTFFLQIAPLASRLGAHMRAYTLIGGNVKGKERSTWAGAHSPTLARSISAPGHKVQPRTGRKTFGGSFRPSGRIGVRVLQPQLNRMLLKRRDPLRRWGKELRYPAARDPPRAILTDAGAVITLGVLVRRPWPAAHVADCYKILTTLQDIDVGRLVPTS